MRAPPARSPAAACLAIAALAAFAWASAAGAQDGGDVTIYRCTGADGTVVIGNVPCAKGSEQEVRSMVRPVDGTPPPAAAPAPTSTQAPPQPVIQYVVAEPAQPLYECVRSDGSTYVNDTGIGEARWVPAPDGYWPLGIGSLAPRGDHRGHDRMPPRADIGRRAGTTSAGSGLSAPPVSRISIPPDPPRPDPDSASGPRPRPPHGHGGWAVAEPGTWERDPCHALPRAETCARLRDRREDIRRRFFNAQQRERDTLRVEERGLTARIDRDCRID